MVSGDRTNRKPCSFRHLVTAAFLMLVDNNFNVENVNVNDSMTITAVCTLIPPLALDQKKI